MLEKDKKIIGTHQDIRIVDHSDVLVPAKIDTGADDSAIYATDIYEKDGILEYKLFSPKSLFFTNQIIKTSDYDVVAVKNSFGDKEFRYKVNLEIDIEGETYAISFNLADRSRSRFPVLIGKKFLDGKFLVDVSKGHQTANSKKSILILKSVIDHKTNDFMNHVYSFAKKKFIISNYKSLVFKINDHGMPSIVLSDNSDVSSYGTVYFKSHDRYREQASAVAQYLSYKHIPFFDSEVGHFISYSKLSEMFVLATNKIPVPKSNIYGGKSLLPKYDILAKEFGNCFVIKNIDSDRGNNNYLVKDENSFLQSIELLKPSKGCIIQKYIENDGFVRVLIMGGQIVQIVKRVATAHKNPLKAHLNKPAGSANATEVDKDECDQEMLILARKSAMAINRNVVGVDLIQDKNTKKWYVLEANYNPEVVDGVDPAKKISSLVKFLEQKR